MGAEHHSAFGIPQILGAASRDPTVHPPQRRSLAPTRVPLNTRVLVPQQPRRLRGLVVLDAADPGLLASETQMMRRRGPTPTAS